MRTYINYPARVRVLTLDPHEDLSEQNVIDCFLRNDCEGTEEEIRQIVRRVFESLEKESSKYAPQPKIAA